MDWSSTSLRVFRAVAEFGSFTAAASTLGYTQSAVSRQIAALETAAGVRLFERSAAGARITTAGKTLLRHASTALDEVDQASRLLHGQAPNQVLLRIGVFVSAGAVLIPEALSLMRERMPHVDVTTREAATPALTRSLRAATLDLAVIGTQPPFPAPDDEDPPLEMEVLLEGELLVAVPAASDIGASGVTTLAALEKASWIGSPHTASEPTFGVWPALRARPTVRHHSRDWLTKLTLVAAGFGITTVPPYLLSLVPDGVRLVRVSDGVPVVRRASLARMPGRRSEASDELWGCLHEAATSLPML